MLTPETVPTWLTSVAWVWICVSVISAGLIALHELVCQPPLMIIMRWVWPINALWMGPFAVVAYWRIGRYGMSIKDNQPYWQAVFKGTTHCGAGCTLGDAAAETLIFLLALQIANRAYWAEVVGDFALAFVFGIAFQFFSIAPMRKLGIKTGLVAAVKADSLSLTAFEVGMFAWMAFIAFWLFRQPLHADRPEYWLFMQIAMAVGFATSYIP